MTNTYNTGNPLGSTDPRDAHDNASNFDEFSNSSAASFIDRLGVARKTIAGAESEIDARITTALANWTQLNSRGAWTTATSYVTGDLWSNGGTLYFVPEDYTSGASAAADIAAGNAIEYTNVNRIQTVTSIADMKAVVPLFEGQVFYLSDGGRSGDFEWVLGDFTSEVAADTLNGVYIKLDSVSASVGVLRRVLSGYVTPEMFGATVGSDCRDAINAASAFRGRLRFLPREYLISGTLYQYRGSFWSGAASIDTVAGRGTIIKKLGDVKAPMLQSERASGLGGGVSTHYYDIENILFHGNSAEQTEEHDGLQLWGEWIGSGVNNVFVTSHFGQAVTFAEGADIKVDRLWVQNIICTSGYAINFNEPYDGTSSRGGLFYGGQIYVENVSNKRGGDPRNIEADRGNAIRLNRLTTVNINELHLEGVRRLVDCESSQLVNINKLSFAHCGLSTDNDACAFRYLTSATYETRIGCFAGTVGNSAMKGFVGMATGVSNGNLLQEYPIGSDYRGGEYSSSNQPSSRNTAKKTVFSNEVATQRIGGASASYLRMFNSDRSSNSYIRQSGDGMVIGSTFNQGGEEDFLEITSSGGSGNRIKARHPLIVSERDTAYNILAGSLWKSSATFSAGEGPVYQSTTGSNSGAGMICAFLLGSGAPSNNANYIGQGYIDTSASPRGVYVAVNIGTGASDWEKLN